MMVNTPCRGVQAAGRASILTPKGGRYVLVTDEVHETLIIRTG